MKKLLSLVLALSLVCVFTACGAKTAAKTEQPVVEQPASENFDGSGAPDNTGVEPVPAPDAAPAPVSSERPLVGLSVSTQNNPFFVTLVDGAKQKADELGIDLVIVDAGDDSAKQTNDIEDLISRNVKVVIVNPVDSSAVAPVIGDVIKAGIKTISVDRGVDGQTVDCAIASDNVLGAELATNYLVELLGEGADVAELVGVEGTSAAIDRGKGFHNVADTKLKVVASQTANFNRAEGLSVMENILQANPNVKGVFAHNDEMALGAVEAVGDKEIVIIGFDATDDALKAVKDGQMKATVAQQPDLMGATAVENAMKLINGEAVEAVIGVQVSLVK